MKHTLYMIEGFFAGSDHVTLSRLIQRFGHDSFLVLIFILMAPNLIPFLCQFGIAEFTSSMVCLLSLQLIVGRQSPWLPRRVAEKQVSTAKLEKIGGRVFPFLYKLDTLTAPRLRGLSSENTYRFYGVMFFILAFLILLPLPFFNYAPAVVIMLSVIGLLSRDGIFVLAGMTMFMGILTGLVYLLSTLV